MLNWSCQTEVPSFKLYHGRFKKCTSLQLAGAAPFEHSNVLVKLSHIMKSWRCSARLHESVTIMSNALSSVQRPKSEVHGVLLGHPL